MNGKSNKYLLNMNKKLNIIGCGYIGQQVALEINQQVDAVAYVKSEESLIVCNKKNISTRRIDLDSRLSNFNVENELILYLVPPQPKGDEDYRINNFINSIGDDCPRKIVLISTTGVYGDCRGEWVDEGRAIKPEVARAKRRASSEKQLIDFCESKNIPWVILRVPGIYGPGKLPVKRISSGEPVVREEDSPYSNRIHAHDLVAICIEAVLSEKITGIYNCSDGHPGTMYDYFMKLSDRLNIKRPPTISLQQAKQSKSCHWVCCLIWQSPEGLIMVNYYQTLISSLNILILNQD